MDKDNKFPPFTKEIPFEVPDNFFESISEMTLARIKQEDRIRRKSRVLWSTFAVAASLVSFLFLIPNFQEVRVKSEPIQSEVLTDILAKLTDEELSYIATTSDTEGSIINLNTNFY